MTIAIDGYSSCGKSTLASQIAKQLHYTYLDSGAMYRMVTLFVLRNQLDIYKNEDISYIINNCNISFGKLPDGSRTYLLNKENVTEEIRSNKINNLVSKVATISKIRLYLVRQQQDIGKDGNIVMDGRDIGTVVFPHADVKFFITADIDVRVNRRYKELTQRGFEGTKEVVKSNLLNRDNIDSMRLDSPLIKATDAIVIDNSDMSKEEQLNLALKLIKEKIIENI